MKRRGLPVHPSHSGAPKKRPQKAQEDAQEPRGRVDRRESHSELPEELARTLPHSIEAEQGVLGSCLISADALGECIEVLTDGSEFYTPAHHTIYEVMVSLWNENQRFDLITFTQTLRDRKILNAVGGAPYITSLFTIVPTAANLTYYLEILREKYILRQIIAAGTEAVRRAYEEQDGAGWELLADTEKQLFSLHTDISQNSIITAKDAGMEALEMIEYAMEHKGSLLGLSTGLTEIDQITNGMQSADMIIIAARPSMGKTALAMNIAEHVAVELRKAVGVFSMEMSAKQLMLRLICGRARVNLQKVMKGYMAERDAPSITAAASRLFESRIFFEQVRVDVQTLVVKARRMKRQHDIQLIVIDYLQLLRARGFKPNERQQEVSFISAHIKELAKELGIPIVVLAQLNRNPEARTGGRPKLSDLRESGSIEQDADIVGLLHRAEVYAEDEEERADRAGEATLDIVKARNGPVGEALLTFMKEYTRFEDRARDVEPHRQLEM